MQPFGLVDEIASLGPHQSVGSILLDMGLDPLQKFGASQSAPDCRAISRPFRNAISVGMLRMPKRGNDLLRLGVELGEVDAGRHPRRRLLAYARRHHPAGSAPRRPEVDDERHVAASVAIEMSPRSARDAWPGKSRSLQWPHSGPSASRSRERRLVVSQCGHATSSVPGAEDRYSSMLATRMRAGNRQ